MHAFAGMIPRLSDAVPWTGTAEPISRPGTQILQPGTRAGFRTIRRADVALVTSFPCLPHL